MNDVPPPPPPGSPPSNWGTPAPAASGARLHPLAVVSLVLSIMGFAPLVIVGGLLGAVLGALALGSINRQPERYRGTGVATAGVGVGLVSGVLVLATFGIVRSDDWGWLPLIATLVYGGLVLGLAVVSHTTAGRAGAVAAVGVVGILAAVVGIIALVLAITFFFRVVGEAFLESLLEGGS